MDTKRKYAWRKRVLCIAVLVLCAAILATGTAAYFTSETTTYNVITTGYLNMELIEENGNGEPWPDTVITGVMPGMTVDKVVYVMNTGRVPFYTRILIDSVATPPEGLDSAFVADQLKYNIDPELWYEQDGYYYYHRAVEPGEKTEPLFTTVVFPLELTNEYKGTTIEINVKGYAVQRANNGKDPRKARGWSSGGTILSMTEEEVEAQAATLADPQ